MTPEERAWCDRIHRLAMDIVGYCGAAELDIEKGTRPARLVHKGGLAALALATEALTRVRDAEMHAAATAPDRFDLAALGALPMTAPELGE